MNAPRCCPFCDSQDIRLLTGSGLDLIGYRCHQCQKAFYVTDLELKPRTTPPPRPKPTKGTRK